MTHDQILKTLPLETQNDHHPLNDASSLYQLRQFPDGKLVVMERQWDKPK
jgi:hypothetical protein